MNKILERIHQASAHAWLVFVQWLNWIAVSVAGAAVAIDTMYHNEVSGVFASLPPIAKLAALVAWAGIIHYGLRSAKKAV